MEGGKYALCFSSGLGATTALMGALKAGDHILCGDDVYGGTNRLLNKVITRFGIEVSQVDFSNPSNVESGIKSNTKAYTLYLLNYHYS